MSAPVLNRRLVLEAPVRTADGAGGYATGWTVLGEVWAAIEAGAAREAAGIATAVSRSTYRLTLRAAPVGSASRPGPDQRFREGTRIFRVLAVTEAGGDGRYLSCLVQEEVAA